MASVALGQWSTPSLHAATSTANLNVSATVGAVCSISTTALAFGSYDPVSAHASTPLDASGSVIVTCTVDTSAVITLGQGSNADTGSTDAAPLRRMASGSNRLAYSVFQNSGRTTAWGNTSGSGVGHTGTGAAATLSVYGRIGAGQSVAPGSYSDVVVATITY